MKIEHNSRSEFYRTPFGAVTQGTPVRIRLGISEGGIPDRVRLICVGRDKKEEYFNMFYVCEIGSFCIYEAEVPPQTECGNLWYYFEAVTQQGHVFYGNNEKRLGGLGKIYTQKPTEYFQITVYSSDYQTPKWWRNSICYQIFCDRFRNGNENGEFLGNRKDIIKRNWDDVPFYNETQFGGKYLSNDFFGGNLKGIEQKLGYLAELGVGALYLNPIFKAYSNHKYDTGDYMQIDEMFGTEEDFVRLAKKAEEYGIKIILDGVFNHTGSNSRYFNKDGEYDSVGAYQSRDSEYYDWYSFSDWNSSYESWWGMLTLPQVNEKSESYQNYILKNDDSVVKRWLKVGASGWRLDVVDELPGFFVKMLRKEVKKQNPQAVIIGEVWEDASNKYSYGEEREYFLGEELDSVMNYPLRDAYLSAVLGKIDAVELDERIMSLKENYPRPAFYSLMNMLSTHDTERILTAASGAPDRRCVNRDEQAAYQLEGEALKKATERVKQLVMLVMLMPGVPCIYYGDEVGAQGYGDPFCRNTYPWGKEDKDMLLWYKTAAALRKGYEAYVDGEYETVYKIGHGFGFIRYLGEDRHIAMANFGEDTSWFRLDLARFGIHCLENELYEEYYQSEDGIYYIEMPSGEVKVFTCKTWK